MLYESNKLKNCNFEYKQVSAVLKMVGPLVGFELDSNLKMVFWVEIQISFQLKHQQIVLLCRRMVFMNSLVHKSSL